MRRSIRSAHATWLVSVLALCASLVGVRHAQPRQPTEVVPQRPNFVLMLSDDQGWAGLSAAMHPTLDGARSELVRTPNLERLAQQGMRFSRGYSSAPVCSPSRVAIQTGRSPGALNWTTAAPPATAEDGYRLVPPASLRDLAAQEETIGELLKGQGYATAHFCKWHLEGGGPGAHGYDAHDGETGNKDAAPFVDPNPGDVFGAVERAIEFMRAARASGRPFHVQLSFFPLHYAQNARPATLAAVRARGGWRDEKEVERAAIAEDLDEAVGRLLAALDELELDASTYVVYTSDNGHSGTRGALSGGKGGLSEGGIRVPFIVRGPGVAANTWCHEPVVGHDLLPTFAELAGAADAVSKAVEGVSFAALLGDPAQGLERRIGGIAFHFPHYQSGGTPESAFVAGALKVRFDYETKSVRLFDVVEDPGEKRDLSKQRPKDAARLLDQLTMHLQAVGAELPRDNPSFDPNTPPREPKRGRDEDGPEAKGKREPQKGGALPAEKGKSGVPPASDDERLAPPHLGSTHGEAPTQALPFLGFRNVSVSWDDDFVYVASNGLPDHPMMVGIRTWNQQVPLPQPFVGTNVFRIPRHPKLLAEPRPTVLEGAIALAVNGVPIFDALTQGGKHDAFEHGELDEFGGHAGRADDYHYHSAPLHLLEHLEPGQPIAFGLDGFPIFAESEVDGRPVEGLDAAHGHTHDDGTFHYHASRTRPYTMGAFAGEVDLEARPRTLAHRPATSPLRGARITEFRYDAHTGGVLGYELRGATHHLEYRLTAEGGLEIAFVGPAGERQLETYPPPGRTPSTPPRSSEAAGEGSRGAVESERQPWIVAHARELDANGDGRLARSEVVAEVERAFDACDRNDDGVLDDAEIETVVDVRSPICGFLLGHRNELDSDADGRRTRAEVLATFERFHARHDRDGDGSFDVPTADADEAAPTRDGRGVHAPSIPVEARATPATARNVVVVLFDDLGWDDVGFMGSGLGATPELDALAKRGLVFERAYASCPNCAPTRACLLTGQWPGRHGIYTVVDERHAPGSPHHALIAAASRSDLAPEHVTLAEELREHKFRTGFFGMWNLGKGATGPLAQGFDTAVAPRDLGFANNAYRDYQGRNLPDALVDAALDFVNGAREERFFCYLALHSVHAPFDPDPQLLAQFQASGADDAAFAATLCAADRALGRLFAGFRELGLADSTLVIVTSDNGGERARAAPLRGGKGELYEGGIRVPCLAFGATVEAERRSNAPFTSLDVFPTVLEATGAAPRQGLDGLSFAEHFAGGSAPQPDALFWHFPCYTGRGVPASAIRVGDLKLVERFEAGAPELYDLASDPTESHDLAATRPEVAAELATRLAAWRTATGAALPPGPNPDFVPGADSKKRDKK